MLSKLFSLFHGAFTGVYPYIAIALLATLSWGLYEKGKVDRVQRAQYEQTLKDTKKVLGVVVQETIRNNQILENWRKWRNTLDSNTQKQIDQINHLQGQCLDQPHGDELNELLNDPPSPPTN